MKKIFQNILLASVTCLILTLTAYGQTDTVCVSQEAANKCGELARTVPALEAKIVTLEAALIEKDKIAAEIRTTAAKNEADLKAALGKTEVELALKTGQLIGAEASNVRSLAVIDVLLKSVRKKCMPFSICF